jgi:COP9 signalosome complex subunit 12
MSSIFSDFQRAHHNGNGTLLAQCLAPINTPHDPTRLESLAQLTNWQAASSDISYYLFDQKTTLPKSERNAWIDIFVDFWKCARELADINAGIGGDWTRAFDTYRELCNHLIRGYTNFGFHAWTIPCLQSTGRYLRMIAIKADKESKAANNDDFAAGLSDDIVNTNKNEKLEQAAWIINRMFTLCLSDRSELTDSRKWGIYSTTNLLFKTYFKLNSLSLTKNVIRALDAADDDLPPLHLFPKPQQCTFKFYRGVIDFLQERYTDAEEHLEEALALCYKHSVHNREQILTYLIPAHVLNHQQLPSSSMLAKQPTLSKSLTPIFKAIKQGNLHAFDTALSEAEAELVHRRIYLTMERTRDLCMRNLFRKVFINAGFEEPKEGTTDAKVRRTRIKIEEFEAAMRVAYRGSDEMVDRDEVECFLANMIYKVSFEYLGGKEGS